MFGFLAANVFCKNDNYAERFRLWGYYVLFCRNGGAFLYFYEACGCRLNANFYGFCKLLKISCRFSRKIQGIYFKIYALYFEISALYFLRSALCFFRVCGEPCSVSAFMAFYTLEISLPLLCMLAFPDQVFLLFATCRTEVRLSPNRVPFSGLFAWKRWM